MADMQAFEHLCRVCAVDTKGKSSVAECVYVLKTADLREKIKKYLDLTVSEDDALPKVICKSCYRSVEGIVSLSKIAVHTQMVLSNFLKPRVALNEPDSEFTTIVSPVKDYERVLGGTAQSNTAKQTSTTTPPVAPQLPKERTKRAEDVIVNVSVSDPLTRETQQKILGASRQRQTLIDSRFIPKSIAHRHVSFATSTPKESATEPMNLNLAKKNNTTPPSAGVINFFNSQQPQQQVTVTSGGYVIGQMNDSTMTNTSSSSTSVKPAPPTPENEPRRKTLKVSTKGNPRGASVGQVSLLKVSQKPSSLIVNPSLSDHSISDLSASSQQAQAPQPTPFSRPRAMSPPPRKARRPQRRPTIAEIPSTVEVLPREIIIASVKKPKTKNPPAPPPSTPVTSTMATAAITMNQATPSPPAPQAHQPQPQSKPKEQTRRSAEAPMPQQPPQPVIPKSLFPDDIPLGRVIRDFDLLKLIMKALKWPVIKENIDAQLERLRNSKFTTIMSDPNLLQDTDLTQLLGPYLAPVMFAAQKLQQQQQQQQNAAAAMISPAKVIPLPKATSPTEMPTDLSATANLANAMPYRLPPETSVQLVPASPEEEPATKPSQHKSRKTSAPTKRSRRAGESPRIREVSIIISDGEEEDPTSHSHSSIKNEKRYEQSNKLKSINEGPDSYDALKQLAERSRAALERVAPQRSRNGADPAAKATSPQPVHYPSFVDDIVLMEPEPLRKANKPPKPQESLPSVISMTSPDNLFQARAVPPITRPIIKRRKTVIHSSAANKMAQQAKINATIELNSSDTKPLLNSDKQDSISAAVQVPSMAASDAVTTMANASAGTDVNKISVATSMSFFTGVTTHITGTTVGTATSTATGNLSTDSVLASPKESKETTKKPMSTKAALAEQLLEAVGLKKANGATIEKTPSRESVQQIRSALKRSLKQAVEQNQRKNEELPVKQLADSTTKSMSKNSKPSDAVDIEEEIEKATLQKTDRQISLLKLKSQDAVKPRNTNRSPRKGNSQASVIKTANEMGDKNVTVEKSKSADNLQDESQVQPKKSTFSQTSPRTSDTNLLSEFISGNNVSSTSEPKAINEAKLGAESKVITAETVQAPKKKSRKRRAIEETGGDGTDISEDAKKKEIKTEFDTKSVAGGDTEVVKESNSNLESELKPEGANSSTRPSRASKTSSKYYKGPDKPLSTRSTRSTRNK